MPLAEQKTSTRVAINNLLFATDFSPAAQTALPYALAIARHYGSVLHAAHIISDLRVLSRPQGDLQTFESISAAEKHEALQSLNNLAPELEECEHRIHVRSGNVADVLSEIILKEHIDLLVVGTHGRSGLGKFVLGSTAEKLVRQALCPVLTVGPKASGQVSEEFDTSAQDFRVAEVNITNVLVAVDFTPECLNAAPLAVSLAEEFQACLTLLHVIDQNRPVPCQSILQRLEDLLPSEVGCWCKPRTIVKFGEAAERILQTALECQADVIVLGVKAAKARMRAMTHLPWSTAHKVIANASCPVLTVRN